MGVVGLTVMSAASCMSVRLQQTVLDHDGQTEGDQNDAEQIGAEPGAVRATAASRRTRQRRPASEALPL